MNRSHRPPRYPVGRPQGDVHTTSPGVGGPTAGPSSQEGQPLHGGTEGGALANGSYASLLAELSQQQFRHIFSRHLLWQVCGERSGQGDTEGDTEEARSRLAVTSRALLTECNYLALRKQQVQIECQRLLCLPQADLLRMGQSLRELDRICGSGSVRASLPEVLQHVHAIADIQLAREGPIAIRIGIETAKRLLQDVPLMDGWTDEAYSPGRVNISTAFAAFAGQIAANETVMELTGPGRFSGKGVFMKDLRNINTKSYWDIRDVYISEIQRLVDEETAGDRAAGRRAVRLSHELLIVCRFYALQRPVDYLRHANAMWSQTPASAAPGTQPLVGLGDSLPASDALKAKRDSISAIHAQFRADFQVRQEALKQRVDHCLGQLAGQPINEADYTETLEAVQLLKLLEESGPVTELVILGQRFYSTTQPWEAVAMFTRLDPRGYALREAKSSFIGRQVQDADEAAPPSATVFDEDAPRED